MKAIALDDIPACVTTNPPDACGLFITNVGVGEAILYDGDLDFGVSIRVLNYFSRVIHKGCPLEVQKIRGGKGGYDILAADIGKRELVEVKSDHNLVFEPEPKQETWRDRKPLL